MERDIQEIKADVKQLLVQSGVHNEILRTHESRSLALQAAQEKLGTRVDERLNPLEKQSALVGKVSAFLLAVSSGLAMQWLMKKVLG